MDTVQTTEQDIKSSLNDILDTVDELFDALRTQKPKADFLKHVGEIEVLCKWLRADVIRHSRALGKGVRADGKPDFRFRANREAAGISVGEAGANGSRKPDLRANRR